MTERMTQTLGDMLVETGRITQTQFELAQREKDRTGAKFGEICERLGFISHEEVLQFVGKQWEAPYLDFSAISSIIDSLRPSSTRDRSIFFGFFGSEALAAIRRSGRSSVAPALMDTFCSMPMVPRL